MAHKRENKEFRLLYEMDSNCRKPFSAIGKKIRMSQQLISYKVKSMAKEGIIKGNYPLIDYSRFGYLDFMVFFRANYVSEKNFAELIERMKKHDSITQLIECDGKYDILATFAAKNPSAFNKTLRKLIVEDPELKNCMILPMVVEHHFLRNYLVRKIGDEDVVVGGDREEIQIDNTNMKIIKPLVGGRKGVMEIAEASKITPKTIISRLKWMEEKGIIKQYRLLLNLRPEGILSNILLLRYLNVSVEKEEEFKNFCKSNPNIIEFIKTFGEWDIILNVETTGMAEFRKLFLEIREKFEDIIEEFDNFRIFMVHKKQFLPTEAFEKL